MMDVDVVDGVATVRLDHPPVNALDLELLDAIVATMGHLGGPVVVTGAGKCFSAGVDLRAIVDGGSEYTDRFITSLSAAFLAVFDHPAPVVAAVNGHAIAGGCVLAMAADVRLMSAGTIGITELAVGVPFPMAALEICRYAMGTSATRAALQADTIDVAAASARGWIDEVVAPADLIPRAIAVARTRTARPNYVRGHEGAAAPTGSHGDRRRRGNGREGARQLDVGRHARPRHRVYRRACTRLTTELRTRHGLQPLDTVMPVAENAR